jgi:hypothetical protein
MNQFDSSSSTARGNYSGDAASSRRQEFTARNCDGSTETVGVLR